MSTLEEELLQLTEKKTTKKPPKKSRNGSDDEVSASGGEDERRGGKRKGKGQDNKPLKKRRADSDDGASSDDEFVPNDGFDDDDFMGDDADREWLLNLPEIEREAIIGERYEKRKELREQWEAKQRLKNNNRQASKNERDKRDRGNKKKDTKKKVLSEIKKRRAKAFRDDDEEEEEGEMRSDDGNDDDADYMTKQERKDREREREKEKQRERERDRDQRERERERDREREREASRRVSSDEELEDEEVPLSLQQLNSIRLNRELLTQWVSKPFFDDIVPGFFVRIGIGAHPSTHLTVYRVAQIDQVNEGRSNYNLPADPNPVSTNKVLKLRIGNKAKEFKMETVSNKPFTDTEYSKWLSEMRLSKEHVMSAGEVPAKVDELNRARNYKYTDEDIHKMLEEKKKEGKVPVKLAAERARLMAKRDAARDTNPSEYEHLCDELNKLEEQAKQRYEKLSQGTNASVLASINLKNKQRNFDKSIAESAKEEKANNELDPFSRRKTISRVLFSAKAKKEEADAAAAADQNNNNITNNNNNNNNNKNKIVNGTPLKASNDRIKGYLDEHNGIDLDLSVELTRANQPTTFSTPKSLLALPTPTTPPPSSPPQTDDSSAKPSKLSIADYMRRRAAVEQNNE